MLLLLLPCAGAGLVVVVSPLLALMRDQLQRLPQGLPGAMLQGSMSRQEVEQVRRLACVGLPGGVPCCTLEAVKDRSQIRRPSNNAVWPAVQDCCRDVMTCCMFCCLKALLLCRCCAAAGAGLCYCRPAAAAVRGA